MEAPTLEVGDPTLEVEDPAPDVEEMEFASQFAPPCGTERQYLDVEPGSQLHLQRAEAKRARAIAL